MSTFIIIALSVVIVGFSLYKILSKDDSGGGTGGGTGGGGSNRPKDKK